MNHKIIAFCLCVIYVASMLGSSAKKKEAETDMLKVKLGTMQIQTDGLSLSLNECAPSSKKMNDEFWVVTVENRNNPSKVERIPSFSQKPKLTAINNGFRLSYDQLQGKRPWNISLVIDFTTDPSGAFVMTPSLNCHEKEWVVTSFTGPIIDGLQTDLTNYTLYMPVGLGQQYTRVPSEKEPIAKLTQKGAVPWKYIAKKKRYELQYKAPYSEPHYPSRFATMQWCTFSGKNGGLYFGSHDSTFASKRFSVRYEPSTNSMGFAFIHYFTCFDNQKVNIPATIVYPYEGSWHNAAKFYRKWYDTAVKKVKIPSWLRNSSGWMLTILKQQNDEIMWPYDSLHTLTDLTIQRCLDVIGLFGWTIGGHDRFYPDYEPDPTMGGRQRLVDGIKYMHQKGVHAIIYANGQLIDQNGTNFWPEVGKHITVVKKNGELDYQKWHKYTDAPARYHGMACLGCDQWYERMLSLAKQANDLGADGIIFDQLAVTSPKFCYASNHGHSVPAVVYEADRYSLLKRIQEQMAAINPDFVLMVEGLTDAEFNSISVFHGYENGAYVPLIDEIEAEYRKEASTSIFPEMFVYTFPEFLTTVRNPAPVNNRLILNYGCMLGLRNELECRYSADVQYLKNDRLPLISDYSNVISKPNLDLVTSQNPVSMKKYTRQMNDFGRQYADLLWSGGFVDTDGFELKSDPSVVAKAFVNGDKMGIVVWNRRDDRPQNFKIDVPGYSLQKAVAPDRTVSNIYQIPAQSIELLIYQK